MSDSDKSLAAAVAAALAADKIENARSLDKAGTALANEWAEFRSAATPICDDTAMIIALIRKTLDWLVSTTTRTDTRKVAWGSFLRKVSPQVTSEAVAKLVLPGDDTEIRTASSAKSWFYPLLNLVEIVPDWSWLTLPTSGQRLSDWWAVNQAIVNLLYARTLGSTLPEFPGMFDNDARARIKELIEVSLLDSVDLSVITLLKLALPRTNDATSILEFLAGIRRPQAGSMANAFFATRLRWPQGASKGTGVPKKYTEAVSMVLRDAARYSTLPSRAVALSRSAMPDSEASRIAVVFDTGATRSFVAPDVYDRLPGHPEPVAQRRCPPMARVTLANGTVDLDEPATAKWLHVRAEPNRPAVRVPVYVLPGAPVDVALGVDAMRLLGGTAVHVGADGASRVELKAHSTETAAAVAVTPPPPPAAGTATMVAATAPADDDNGASFFGSDTPVLFIFDGATPAEAVLIEAHGSDICGSDGQLQIRHDQVAAIRSVAKAVAAVPHQDGDAQAAAVHAALVPPVLALFRPDYTSQDRDVVLDHHAHVAPSAQSPDFKYKSGTEAFLDRLNATDMPAPLRAHVAHQIQHVIKPTLLSKDAPPQQYGPFRGAVFSLRVRRGAELRGVNDSWRPMSKDKFDFLQAQAETWVKFGVLEPVQRGETFVVSQPVVVAKRGKDDVVTGYRAAFDFRKLNAVLEQDKLAPEPVRNIAEHAANAWRTTSLDATALFNQFELDEDSRFLTTVMIRPGVYYRFRCAPFGLSSILGFAQHTLDEFIRADDAAVKVYVDDIVIAHYKKGDWSAAADELLRVLRRCAERNLALNADKAELFQLKLVVVGHAIDCDTHTFRPRTARLQALAEFPRPTTARKLRGFLAMASAWSRFVPAWPMHQSLLSRFVSEHRKGPLVWTAEATKAFHEAKRLIAEAARAREWSPTLQTYVYTDACASGIAWAVTQPDKDGNQILVDCGGRKTAAHESKLYPQELEVLAFRDAAREVPHMIIGTAIPPIWRTDSRAATLLREQKTAPKSNAVRRWLLEMQFGALAEIRAEHIDGAKNPVDALSRVYEDNDDHDAFAHLRHRAAEPTMMMFGTVPAELVAGEGAASDDAAEDDSGEGNDGADAASEQEDARDVVPPTPPLAVQSTATSAAASEDETPHSSSVVAAPENVVRPETATVTTTEKDDVEVKQHELNKFAAAVDADPVLGPAWKDERIQWGVATVRDPAALTQQLGKATREESVNSAAIRRFGAYRDEFGRIFVFEGGKRKLLVPTEMLDSLAVTAHQALGHRAADGVLRHLRQQFHSPALTGAVKRACEACVTCQQLRARGPDGIVGRDDRFRGRFEHVHIDVCEFDGAQRYCLVAVDRVTGAVEAAPMTTRTAAEVAETFERIWLYRYPRPRVLTSDNAAELVGEEMHRLAVTHGFALEPVAPRNPQANGLAEVTIRGLKTAIRALTRLGGDWREALPKARWSMVAAVSTTRGVSPLLLTTGATAVAAGAAQHVDAAAVPPDEVVAEGDRAVAQWHAGNVRAVTSAAVTQANASRDKVAKRVRRATEKKAGGKVATFAVGDIVWVENNAEVRATKFDNRWRRDGPWQVVEVQEERLRAKVVVWATRAPRAGWVSFHRMSPARGERAELLAATSVERPDASKDSAASQQAAAGADTAVDARVVAPVEPKPKVWPIRVPSEYGIVLDIVHTHEGSEMLIDDGTGVITTVRADTIPKEVIAAARKAKRDATRRLVRK